MIDVSSILLALLAATAVSAAPLQERRSPLFIGGGPGQELVGPGLLATSSRTALPLFPTSNSIPRPLGPGLELEDRHVMESLNSPSERQPSDSAESLRKRFFTIDRCNPFGVGHGPAGPLINIPGCPPESVFTAGETLSPAATSSRPASASITSAPSVSIVSTAPTPTPLNPLRILPELEDRDATEVLDSLRKRLSTLIRPIGNNLPCNPFGQGGSGPGNTPPPALPGCPTSTPAFLAAFPAATRTALDPHPTVSDSIVVPLEPIDRRDVSQILDSLSARMHELDGHSLLSDSSKNLLAEGSPIIDDAQVSSSFGPEGLVTRDLMDALRPYVREH